MKAQNEEPEMKDYFPDSLKDLIGALLQKEPSSWPTAIEALNFEFFKD